MCKFLVLIVFVASPGAQANTDLYSLLLAPSTRAWSTPCQDDYKTPTIATNRVPALVEDDELVHGEPAMPVATLGRLLTAVEGGVDGVRGVCRRSATAMTLSQRPTVARKAGDDPDHSQAVPVVKIAVAGLLDGLAALIAGLEDRRGAVALRKAG